MNRRSFISGLIRVGAFVAFSPNRLVFDFGRKLFLPEPEWFTISGSLNFDGTYIGKSARAFEITQGAGLDRIEMLLPPGVVPRLEDVRFPWDS
jgi:hypothetical protein